MKNIAILGASYGDEGKGRIVHDFSSNYDWVVRFNGGANAGHTIYRDGVKYVHNLMPSFDWRSDKPKAYLGSGMVIDLSQLHKEVKSLYDINTSYASRVYVDIDAFVVLPEHKEEDKKNNGHIGSTNRGIGPAYKSKINRNGIRISNIINASNHHDENYQYIQSMISMGVQFTNVLLLRDIFRQSSIIFEGAQGILLDINHGIYPYVSCSDSTVAGVYANGFNFVKIDKVYGISKCYLTKVGEGPFPTEIYGDMATELRERGQEYGATTGRPRRIGWLDLPALKYACLKGGITDLIITKLDILNGMLEISVCDKYGHEPTSPKDFYSTITYFKKIKGWNNPKNVEEVQPLISLIESAVDCSVSMITFGVNPEDKVLLK